MGLRSRNILKTFFEKKDFPTAAQFIDLIDSCLNLVDDSLVGLGDMLKSVYDTNDNGVVDNSELVNGLTVETAVPAGAVFGDVSKVGTPVNTQVGYWTGDGTLAGSNNFTFDGVDFTLSMVDGSTVFMGGNLGLGNPAAAINAELSATSGQADLTGSFSDTRQSSLACYSDASDAYVQISVTNSIGTAQVGMDGRGLVYNADYASRNTSNPRWIPDKAYVDALGTDLSFSRDATTVTVESSDGTNAILPEANTTNAGILGSDKWDEIVANTAKPALKTAASGLPSTTGAGDIDMSRVNDYYSETAITANVTWGLTNIVADKVSSVDMKTGVFSVTLVQSGVTFKGAVNGSGVVQGLDATKSNLISLWAQTATIIWVTVILNEA